MVLEEQSAMSRRTNRRTKKLKKSVCDVIQVGAPLESFVGGSRGLALFFFFWTPRLLSVGNRSYYLAIGSELDSGCKVGQ